MAGRSEPHYVSMQPFEKRTTSGDQLDLARAPFLGEERLKRSVEAQDYEPALARHGLNPVAVLCVGWLGWSEIDCRGAVRVRNGGRCRVGLASCTREALRRLEHGASLIVIQGERPEILCRDIRWQ